MTYKINVEYQTGDSFGSEDTDEDINLTWENVDIAKENLQRIKEHYNWYSDESRSNFWRKNIPKPNFECSEYYLHLLDDNRKEVEVCASWCGYFERLYGAKIVNSKPDGWSFRVD